MTDSFDPVERAGHVAELGFAEVAIQSAGYRTENVAPADPTLVPELVVHLGDDEAGRDRTLRMSFVPIGGDLASSKLLQMWCPLPFAATPELLDEVRRAVAIVNEQLAIGRFGVRPDGAVYFRYVLAARANTMIDDDLIAEMVAFVDFHQEHFGDFVEGVCDGDIAIEVLDDVIRAAG